MPLFIHDNADKTPPRPSGEPPHRTISGADFDRSRRAIVDFPWHVSVAIGVVLLVLLGLVVLWVVRWAERNPETAALGQLLLMTLLFVLALAGTAWALVALYFSLVARYGQALRAHIERTRLGVPVPVQAIASMRVEQVFSAEQSAIDLEIARAPYTKYPLLSTLSEGSHEEATTTINGVAEEVQAPPLLPEAGPILDQLRKRYNRSADHLFVGTVGETAVHLRWGTAGLTAIAGGSGGGKTNTTRLIAAWHALNGGGLALCDGHGEVDEGLIASCQALSSAFVLPPAVKDLEIAAVIHRMDAIGRARLAGTEPKDIPLLLVVDEFTSLCRNHNDAAKLINCLLNFGDEYRKVNMQALIIGHHWRGDLIDKQLGAALRAAIGERIVHNTAPEEAKFLLKPIEAQGVDRLKPGEALFFGRSADVQKIVVPWLPAEALREVQYPPHPGWPLSVETPRSPDDLNTKLRQSLRTLTPDKRAAALRQFALARDAQTRTGWKYTTDELRDLFGMRQNDLVAIVGVLRNGRDSGLRQSSATVATIDPL